MTVNLKYTEENNLITFIFCIVHIGYVEHVININNFNYLVL